MKISKELLQSTINLESLDYASKRNVRLGYLTKTKLETRNIFYQTFLIDIAEFTQHLNIDPQK